MNRAVRIGLSLAAVAYLAYLALAPRHAMLALLSDDAFYYLEIARNIVAGRGSTFDGIVATNGYHPLWMGAAIALEWLSGGHATAAVIGTMALCGGLALATLGLLHGLVERHVAPGFGAVAVTAALLPHMLIALTNGLETSLLLLLAVVTLEACYRWGVHRPEASASRRVAGGALLAGVFLARLDSALWVIAVGALFLGQGLARRMPPGRLVGRAVPMALGFLVLAAPYLAWNLLAFGQLMPISGGVKSTLPALRPALTFGGDLALGGLLLAGALLASAIDAAARRRTAGGLGEVLASPLLALTGGCVLHFLHCFLFLDWGVYWWHFALYGLACALGAARVAALWLPERPPAGSRALQGALLLLVACSALFQGTLLRAKASQHEGWLRAAEWANASLPPESIVALNDAGLFGYFSAHPVVNLDGKANGVEYQGFVADGDVLPYLRRVGVTHLADVGARYRGDEAILKVPRAGGRFVRVPLDRAGEVYRGEPSLHARSLLGYEPAPPFKIWRMPEPPR